MFSFRRITFVIAVYLTSQTVANSKETSTISERVQIYDETDVQAPCVLEECADSISNSNSRENQRDWSVSWESIEDWKFGDSGKCPTGRLFDSRWKKLREDILFRPYVEQGIPDPGIRVFSIRVKENITISLVGWSKLVQIYVGTTRIEFLTIYYNSLFKTNTWKNNLYYPPKFVDQDGWRTFTLEWKKSSTEIKLTTSSLNNFYINETLDHSPYLFYNLSIESSSPTRIRFHNYTYLHTTNPGAELITSDSFEENEDFCIETLTRLCNGCKLNFYIIDYHNSINELGNINYDGEYAKDDKWITLRIDQSKIKSRSWPKKLIYPVKIKLSTDMVTTPRSGRWAIANYRKCSSEETSNTMELKASSIGIGIVEIRWKNPWISRSTNPCTLVPSYCYTEIEVRRVGSKISNYPPEETRFNCVCAGNESFKLQSATEYRFDVKMTNSNNDILRDNVTFWIPASVGFANGAKELEVKETDTSIDITIPKILNIMSDSIVKIIVDGRTSCSNHSVSPDLRNLLINGKDSGKAWIVRSLEDPKNVPQIYSIPKKMPNDKTSSKCHLLPAETYYVIVAVVDSADQLLASISSKPITLKTFKADNKQTLEWFYIVLILAICLLTTTFAMFRFYTSWKRIKSRTMDNDKVTLITPIGTPGDWQFDGCSHPVELKEFGEYVKKAVADGELELQFRRLPTGLLLPHRIASLPENKNKNRDQNLVAYVNPRHGNSLTNVCTKLTSRYSAIMKSNSCQSAYPTSHPYETLYMLLSADDHTRVILTKRSCNFGSNYINANYISGYCKEKGYIATQAPMPETVVDFWTMIWQEEVLIVCMLQKITEDGQKTCEQYWPEIGNTVKHGDITILNVKQRVYADYCYRILQVTKYHETCSREIHHLQYTGWPEQEVPMYWHSIVEYFNELRGLSSGPGPIVVHCATGTGRTGTFILCDLGLHSTAAEGTVDLFAEASKMYTARANMLENLQQYILAHLLPTQCLLTLPTKLSCSDVTREEIGRMKKDLRIHMRRLGISVWKEKALRPSYEPLKPPNPDHLQKNRFPKFIPVEHSLVNLKRYPPDSTDSDYISAVSVDGVKVKGQYLASQLPLPSTLSDFWRLVAEKRTELIVILQRPRPEGVECVDIVPRKTSTLRPVPHIVVKTETLGHSDEHFTTDKLELIDTSEEAPRTQNITVLTCNGWNLSEDGDPPQPKVLVKLYMASERVQRVESPTLVLCYDGVTGCGLYLALSILLERMAVEQECDVISAVRAIRQSRRDFVYSKAQFEYLYDAALEFVQDFGNYSNMVSRPTMPGTATLNS